MDATTSRDAGYSSIAQLIHPILEQNAAAVHAAASSEGAWQENDIPADATVRIACPAEAPACSDPIPEIGELDRIEQRSNSGNFTATHLHEPSVGIAVQHPVQCCAFSVEQANGRMAVSVNAAVTGAARLSKSRLLKA
jgi:hypothetical protein